MADDYAGYKAHFTGEACIELACLAHTRRKFFDLHQANKITLAEVALQRMAFLYAIEAEAKDLDSESRQLLRQDNSLAALASLHDWLIHVRMKKPQGVPRLRPSNIPLNDGWI